MKILIAKVILIWIAIDLLLIPLMMKKGKHKGDDRVIKIELNPCYPGKPTLEEQLQKVEEEYNEVLAADDWEDRAKELLDVMQTVVGLMDVICSTGESEVFAAKRPVSFDEDVFCYSYNYFHRKFNKHQDDYMRLVLCNHYASNVLSMFYSLICQNDRGCIKYREELFDRILDEHNQKLEIRKKEWEVAS